MAQIVIGGCMSHSPLINHRPPPEDAQAIERFRHAAMQLGMRIRDAKVDVLLVFGQDHFRSFFYDNMPAFCLGVGELTAWGDWGTQSGALPTSNPLARHICRSLLSQGFDPAMSYALRVDHGVTQPLALCDLDDIPVIPILINCLAPPLPSVLRCYQIGQAVRRAIGDWAPQLRVAVIGSGGLSHAPPQVNVDSEDPEDSERVQWAIHGHDQVISGQAARESRLLHNYREWASGIRREWDRQTLAAFSTGQAAQYAACAAMQTIDADAGAGGQEIRTWLAAAGALGDPCFDVLSYETPDFLITGMAVVAARDAPHHASISQGDDIV